MKQGMGGHDRGIAQGRERSVNQKRRMAVFLLAAGLAVATLFGGHDEAQADGRLSATQAWQMYTTGTTSWFTQVATFDYWDWVWLPDYEGYWRNSTTGTFWHYWTPSWRHNHAWYVTNLVVDNAVDFPDWIFNQENH